MRSTSAGSVGTRPSAGRIPSTGWMNVAGVRTGSVPRLEVKERQCRSWEEIVAATRNTQVEFKLPDTSQHLKADELEKLCADDVWQMRKIVVTHTTLMMTRIDSDLINDSIPLHEIVGVQKRDTTTAFQESSPNLMRETSTSPSGTGRRTSLQPMRASFALKHQGTGAKCRRKSSRDEDAFDVLPSRAPQSVFQVNTVENGFNSGRSYFFRTTSPDACDCWVSELKKLAHSAKVKHENVTRFRRIQSAVRKIYVSTATQTFVALLIIANFAASAFETQINPSDPEQIQDFKNIDLFFTTIFTVELCVNAFAHWWWPFIKDGWNWFDILVVVASIVSSALDSGSGVRSLRLVRAFRVIRAIRRMANLRNLINSLTASVAPVINAMMIVFLTCSIYAVIGVSLFRDRDDALFGSFAKALFTMFQVSTMDGWSLASRNLFDGDELDPATALFFMSFIVVVTWTLLPVVVAVLLDNFTMAAKREKDRAEELRLHEKRGPTVENALDPLLASMLHYDDDADLKRKIESLFKVLDADHSGALSFEEMVEAFKKIPAFEAMHFSYEDFASFTEDLSLCDQDGALTIEGFERMVRTQMKLYLHRQIGVAVRLTEGEEMAMSLLLSGLKALSISVDKLTAEQTSLAHQLKLQSKLIPAALSPRPSTAPASPPASNAPSPAAHAPPRPPLLPPSLRGANCVGLEDLQQPPKDPSPLSDSDTVRVLEPSLAAQPPPPEEDPRHVGAPPRRSVQIAFALNSPQTPAQAANHWRFPQPEQPRAGERASEGAPFALAGPQPQPAHAPSSCTAATAPGGRGGGEGDRRGASGKEAAAPEEGAAESGREGSLSSPHAAVRLEAQGGSVLEDSDGDLALAAADERVMRLESKLYGGPLGSDASAKERREQRGQGRDLVTTVAATAAREGHAEAGGIDGGSGNGGAGGAETDDEMVSSASAITTRDPPPWPASIAVDLVPSAEAPDKGERDAPRASQATPRRGAEDRGSASKPLAAPPARPPVPSSPPLLPSDAQRSGRHETPLQGGLGVAEGAGQGGTRGAWGVVAEVVPGGTEAVRARYTALRAQRRRSSAEERWRGGVGGSVRARRRSGGERGEGGGEEREGGGGSAELAGCSAAGEWGQSEGPERKQRRSGEQNGGEEEGEGGEEGEEASASVVGRRAEQQAQRMAQHLQELGAPMRMQGLGVEGRA